VWEATWQLSSITGSFHLREHSRSVFAMWFLTEREKRQVLYIALVITDVVHLEGGMGDIELVGEELFEFAAAGVAVFVAADEDVG
jgi:hypothetical protein